MFSRYKKPGQTQQNAASPARSDGTTKTAPVERTQSHSLRKPSQAVAAKASDKDKERKRKERLGEIKVELHRSLLDNLNLSALDTATESDLKAEISSIATS